MEGRQGPALARTKFSLNDGASSRLNGSESARLGCDNDIEILAPPVPIRLAETRRLPRWTAPALK